MIEFRPIILVDYRPGIVEKPLDETFKKNHRLTLSILRTFGFGDRCVMENRINHEVENLVAELAQYQSKPVYPLMIVTGSVVNVIASILFGRHFERSDPDLADLIIHTNRFVQEAVNLIAVNLFPSLRYLPPVRRRIEDFSALQRWLLDFLQRKIDETLSREEDDDTASFIRSFIEAEGRNSYDRDELLFILRDMIVAGSETSATTVMWAIALLADHRDIQARLHDEIDAVVGVGGEVGVGRQRLPSLTDRSRLPYVEAFILEVMRFKTIVPLGVPRETVRETEIDGYTIPAGAMVIDQVVVTRFLI